MYTGEYIQPLIRKQFVQCPVISGYVAARLQAEDSPQPVISGTGTMVGQFGTTWAAIAGVTAMVTYENVGNTAFVVMLKETSDRSVSGARVNIANSVTVVPGGSCQQMVSNALPFLEVWCTGSGPGELRLQLESQRQWRQLGFDKVDDATFYPTSLWQAKEAVGKVSSP